ncbi:MAG: bifunctional riboflavin kinase/FAD synthetase [Bacteroidia bacterium]
MLTLLPVKVYRDINSFPVDCKAVVTIGTFDGVHAGHRKILDRLKSAAERTGGETVVFTFYPHPRLVLFPDQPLQLLNTQEEKIDLLEKSGIHHLVIQPFTREFSMMTHENFIKNILVDKLHSIMMVVGYDHHFGKDRGGSFENLRKSGVELGFEVEEIPAFEIDDVGVSSTKIRNALLSCDIKTANSWLGYSYRLSGTVVKGRQLGRTIGFPTANLLVDDPQKMIPADGVYAVYALTKDGKYPAMLNIGKRPTVDGMNRTVEAHILGYNTDIYGETLGIEFAERIRDEQKFSGLDELKNQIQKDRDVVLKIIKR